jgi:hypothetical protein
VNDLCSPICPMLDVNRLTPSIKQLKLLALSFWLLALVPRGYQFR